MSEFVHTSLATAHHGWLMAWIWGSCTQTSGVYLSFGFPFMYSRFYLYSATLWQEFLPSPPSQEPTSQLHKVAMHNRFLRYERIFQTNRVLPSIRQLPMDLRICHILIELIDDTTVVVRLAGRQQLALRQKLSSATGKRPLLHCSGCISQETLWFRFQLSTVPNCSTTEELLSTAFERSVRKDCFSSQGYMFKLRFAQPTTSRVVNGKSECIREFTSMRLKRAILDGEYCKNDTMCILCLYQFFIY